MPDKKLSSGPRKVRSRKQEEDYYCGPAVAQMILGGLGVNRTQDHLWDKIQDQIDVLGLPKCEPCEPIVECVETRGSPPEALAAVIDSLTTVHIKLVSEASAAATDHAVVWSVTNDVAASVLVEGWQHWVVVYGYRVNRPPTSVTDTGYVLQGFHVRDPEAKPATRFVTSTHWRDTYLTGVQCGRFKGRFVAVCDPDETLPKGGPRVPKAKSASGTRLVSAQRATQAARRGIEEAGLLTEPGWREAMKQAKAGEPRLVHRLDRPQSFYFLVPFARSGTVTAQALVDGASGQFLEAQAAEGTRESLPVPDAPTSAAALLCRQRIDVPGWRRNALLRSEGVTASPTLVWKPCRESHSPYLPFTMLTYGNRQFYMRADGEVFATLTESVFGS